MLLGGVQTILADLKTAGAANPISGYAVNANSWGIPEPLTVEILSSATTVVLTARTDPTGFYVFDDTSALSTDAEYTVRVTTKNFTTSTPESQTFRWAGTTVAFDNFVLN